MKRYFITGGTGTLGMAVTKHLLKYDQDCEIVVFSRDEFKQWNMSSEIKSNRVIYILGDVRDKERVLETSKGADFIIHAAAYKHVASAENHPFEVIQTNITGTKNVVDAANYHNATMVLVSSDKAVEPANLYGCTKMAAEAITLNAGQRVCRYGNVFGSRGSVLHRFNEWAETGHTFKITDLRMTRFVITVQQAVDLVLDTLKLKTRSLNIPKLNAMRIVDLAKAFDSEAIIEEIGIQPGEKLHESLEPGVTSEQAHKLSVAEIKEMIDVTLRHC